MLRELRDRTHQRGIGFEAKRLEALDGFGALDACADVSEQAAPPRAEIDLGALAGHAEQWLNDGGEVRIGRLKSLGDRVGRLHAPGDPLDALVASEDRLQLAMPAREVVVYGHDGSSS